MMPGLILQFACVLGSVLVAGGCGAETGPEEPAIEWHSVPAPGGSLDVALVRPARETGSHPVILALPWGSGSAELVESFVRSYWLTEPAARGYYVVAPAVLGPTLRDTADDVIPAIFSWMEDELSVDDARVGLVGASNGGRGLFFAALSQPDRFHALIGLPASYSGDASGLSVLAGKPIWLLVGELDDGWVQGAEATVAALDAHGITAALDIVPGEGHVMRLDPRALLDWMDGALGR